MGQDACVSAFTAVTRASDTNGSGAGHSGLDTVWTETPPHPDTFALGEGPWGVAGARRDA
jgi:hypothetical protein